MLGVQDVAAAFSQVGTCSQENRGEWHENRGFSESANREKAVLTGVIFLPACHLTRFEEKNS